MMPFNSHIFDQVELDTNVLTPQIVFVAQVRGAGRYRGTVRGPNREEKTFSLVVAPSPAEPSVNVNVSQAWTGDPVYSVVEKGYVVLNALSGQGGYTVQIGNDKEQLFDNQMLQVDQIVVLRVLRPGKHTITDQTGGATCNLTVSYPTAGVRPPAGKIDLQVKQIDKTHTEMDKKDLTVSVAQAIAVHVQDKTRIVTTLVATTDRVGSEIVTTIKV